MALTDRLMNDLRFKLPGAIDPTIKNEIWNMLDEFCREGHAWREVIDVALTVDQDNYQPTPAGTEIVHVYDISHATLDVNGAIYDYGTLLLPNMPTLADTETPLFVDAALTPSLDVGADLEALIPADMWSRWHAYFMHGVLGRMMSQVAKPYSNPTLAVFHLRSFRSGVAIARHQVRTKGVIGAQLWRFPPFARGRHR